MADIQIIKKKISCQELKKIADEQFGDLVKAVVDVEKGIIGNRSRGVDHPKVREKIVQIINSLCLAE